ncbi:Erythronate-4-phosphate dehydrogenase [Fusobacterium sp. DD29]|uniref:NAD(P)-dependent oxidoreductase n=1 Tax=unclassified Fusobacterium TaxID=2648384 RepID=UPI001B8D4C53|nr:Erythronate-4-phosphate dehydrogenase [Fusobacterium sp. DD45]MBR8710773.1 Erythronate-4-phosphate dehydrogenase [Fusobacterium sp. DD28]MBR8748918.1 Erythronate-4-phosphate dehydrogenase [Fusobacterium sp. DD29]MBR8751381.1 Erythronate-4-phosphate dehydrogenase [Fusobacterium sp. DD26]MBR8761180.1 Erythronate-4-phosphate dehydrogenase [Fusobacterium sp. DD25]MBR8767192.1 Erythronate-4-phosphate dehydrogenase [Fusobacterium sp. DD43]MBR8771242.1 Erythronate-4-phosphate dehydrogenase [Fusob
MKILITGALKLTTYLKKKLEKKGFEIIYIKNELEKIDSNFNDIVGVICNNFFKYNDIRKFKNLKFIQVTSAGLDRLPLNYINNNNIALFRASHVYDVPISEWVVLGILYFYKNLPFFIKNMKEKRWEKKRNLRELNDKKICIIGCGQIGIECAKRLKSFDCKIIGIDIYKDEKLYFDKIYSIEMLNQILKTADIVILTVPLTESTHHIINKDNLYLLKEDSILINVSRGGLIDEKVLIDLLKKKSELQVMLDVFEKEPLEEENELWELDNVLILPHNSFVSIDNNERLEKRIIENIEGLGY